MLANFIKVNYQGQMYLYIIEEHWKISEESKIKLVLYKFDFEVEFNDFCLGIVQKIKNKYLELVGITEIFENIVN